MAQRRKAVEMSESDVKVIVNDSFALYEEKTAKPRHEENLGNFTELFRVLNLVKGMGIALIALVGIPGCVASILVIISKVKGH